MGSVVVGEKYFLFDGAIVPEKVNPLIDFVQNTPGDLVIGMNSNGGATGVGRFLTHVLNRNKDRITLINVNRVSSAAFEVFYAFQGKKILLYNVSGMMHRGYVDVSIDSAGKGVYHHDVDDINKVKYEAAGELEMATLIMTPAELKKFKKGDDIYFGFDRMKQIFHDAELY